MAPPIPSPNTGTSTATSTGKSEKGKKLVQLNLRSATKELRGTIVSEKQAAKNPRNSSSDSAPIDASVEPETHNLKVIKDNLEEIKRDMITKSDIGTVVKDLMAELKTDLICEIKKTLKEDIKNEIQAEIKLEMEKVANKIVDDKLRQFATKTDEKIDAINMDLTHVRQDIQQQKRELQRLSDELKATARNAQKAISMANFNQQYSQKCNIKITGWKEKAGEDLRKDFCEILREKVDVNPNEILAIHRIPGKNGETRPVIVRMVSTESKTKIIRHRKDLRPQLNMMDHITSLNAKLIHQLKEHRQVQSAWYYNSKVFAQDKNDRRHTFDIFDDLDKNLR